MNLHQIFTKKIDRNIEGVIKADDMDGLQVEIEEYVLTGEISKRLEVFLEAYNNYHGTNGVWISGFFGSGKSHLLKMLALLLENQMVGGQAALDYFLPKCTDNAYLQAELRKAVAIPSRSILFNIDQKADNISKAETDALLTVFVKVFNEACGYYGKHGYVAQFERDLDDRGLLEAFKQTYREIAGRDWTEGRELAVLENANIARAYAHVSGTDEAAVAGIVDKYRIDYKMSIEDFAEMVRKYIEKQPAGFRLNFLVDEVGQFIADNIKLMTNLQTIAESLATKCRGRAWVLVTAQEDMITVLGEMDKRQGNDFSKIQARFATRMKLTSRNVDEVIKKRLLEKTTTGQNLLAEIYTAQKNNFGTLLSFTDNSVNYRGFSGQSDFVDGYPFLPYQFTLFQSAIENLSTHNAFEGRHSSVGERSMLGVFQEVVKKLANNQVGELATFDLMYEGIRDTLKSQIQSAIRVAEEHLGDPFAVRVLKALFLVKYVKPFKATAHNIRILMLDRFDTDVRALRTHIERALDLLEQQTYIQRNGDVYEFLTDEEKDIEQEIKHTDIDTLDIANELSDLLFTDVVRDTKIRHDETKQDFQFSKKLDDRLIGRDYELTIHFVSPFYELHDNTAQLQAHSMGKAELMIVLPPDDRMMRDLALYKQTEKYIKQTQSTALPPSAQVILQNKGRQNQDRMEQLCQRVQELVSRADMFISGEKVDDIAPGDPRTRIARGFAKLVARTYPNLKMLRGVSYSENQISTFLNPPQGGFLSGDTAMSEPEIEMLTYIRGISKQALRVTIKTVADYFSRRPFGWSLAAIQCMLAKLCAREKVEVRADSNILSGRALESALKTTHGYSNVMLTPQTEYSASQVRRLKNFFGDFFDSPPGATEPRALGEETIAAFTGLVAELQKFADKKAQYPFLSVLDELLTELRQLTKKSYDYFLGDLSKNEDRLSDWKESLFDPIRRFMNGEGKIIYDEVSRFLQHEKSNFIVLHSDTARQLHAILADPQCYRGNKMRDAKRQMATLATEIEQAVAVERATAATEVEALKQKLQAMAEYGQLPAEKQTAVSTPFEHVRRRITDETNIALIRDTRRQFENGEYARLMTQVTQWAQEQNAPPEGSAVREQPVEYVAKTALSVNFSQAYLADAADVDAYLTELKRAMLAEIERGKRIRL